MRSVTRILFSLSISSGGFETDRIHEFVEIVNNALVKAVELRALLLLQFAVADRVAAATFSSVSRRVHRANRGSAAAPRCPSWFPGPARWQATEPVALTGL